MAKVRTILPVSCCSRVSSVFRPESAVPILPISVDVPVAVTSARPRPLTISEPE